MNFDTRTVQSDGQESGFGVEADGAAVNAPQRGGIVLGAGWDLPSRQQSLPFNVVIDARALQTAAATALDHLSDRERAELRYRDMSFWEKSWYNARNYGSSLYGGFTYGIGSAVQGSAQLLDAAGRKATGVLRWMGADKLATGLESINLGVLDSVADYGERMKAAGLEIRPDGVDASAGTDFVFDLGNAASNLALVVTPGGALKAAGAGSRAVQGTTLAFSTWIGGAQAANQMYDLVSQDAASQEERDNAVLASGMVGGLLSQLSGAPVAGWLMRRLGTGIAQTMTRVGGSVLTEGAVAGIQGAVQSVSNDVIRQHTTNPNVEVDWKKAVDSGRDGVIFGALLKGTELVPEVSSHLTASKRRAGEGVQGAQEIFAAVSELREQGARQKNAGEAKGAREGAAAGNVSGEVAGPEERQGVSPQVLDRQVYLPPDVALKPDVAQALERVSPELALEVRRAQDTGDLVSLPVRTLADRSVPRDVADALIGEVRVSADAMSGAEGRAYLDKPASVRVAEAVKAVVSPSRGDGQRFVNDLKKPGGERGDGQSGPDGADAARVGEASRDASVADERGRRSETIDDNGQIDEGAQADGKVDGNADAAGEAAQGVKVDAEVVEPGHVHDDGTMPMDGKTDGAEPNGAEFNGVPTRVLPRVSPDAQGEGTTRLQGDANRGEQAHAEALIERSVGEEVRSQLEGAKRLTHEQRDALAELAQAYVQAQADRLGMAPQDLMARLGQGWLDGAAQGGGDGSAPWSMSRLAEADLHGFVDGLSRFFLSSHERLAQGVRDAQARGETVPESGLVFADDMATVRQWLGVKSEGAWEALGPTRRRALEERFVRGFERYLMEGKAPSQGLARVFFGLRNWLLGMYRRFRGEGVPLRNEVRAVFDRMLASDVQVAQTQLSREMRPLFASADEAGMSPEAFARYEAARDGSARDAVADLQAKGLRDLGLLHGWRGKMGAGVKRTMAGARKRVREEVRQAVLARPVYQAQAFLRAKTGGGRLSRDALVQMYGRGGEDGAARVDWKRLQTAGLVETGKTGLHPDVVAERFGFESGDALVQELLGAPRVDGLVDSLTDAQMVLRYGELASPQALMDAADAAVHNGERAEMVALESAVLEQRAQRMEGESIGQAVAQSLSSEDGGAVQARGGLPEDARAVDGQRVSQLMAQADAAQESVLNTLSDQANAQSQAQARVRVQEMSLEALDPKRFSAAQELLARHAREALAAGDVKSAAVLKRQELFQTHASHEAYAAKSRVMDGLEVLVKHEREARGQVERGWMDGADAAQVSGLLARFGLSDGNNTGAGRVSADANGAEQGGLAQVQPLGDWLKAQEAQGLKQDVPEWVRDEGFAVPAGKLTVAQFGELVEVVKRMAALAGRRHELLVLRAPAAVDGGGDVVKPDAGLREVLLGRLEAGRRRPVARILQATDAGLENVPGDAAVLQGVKDAPQAKVAALLRAFDGEQGVASAGDAQAVVADGIRAPWQRLVGEPLWAARSREVVARAEFSRSLVRVLEPLMGSGGDGGTESTGGRGGERLFFPGLGRGLSAEERLVVALYAGNAASWARLKAVSGWRDEMLAPVLQSLGAREWRAVQQVWNVMARLRDGFAQKESRVYGVAPVLLQRRALEVSGADGKVVRLAGGWMVPGELALQARLLSSPGADGQALGALQGGEGGSVSGGAARLGAWTSEVSREALTVMGAVEDLSDLSGRGGEVKGAGAPLLSLEGLLLGMDAVSHDLAWHETLVDVSRVLGGDEVQVALRDSGGRVLENRLWLRLSKLAHGDRAAMARAAVLPMLADKGAAVSALAGAMGSEVLSGVKLGYGLEARWVAAGVKAFLADPAQAVRDSVASSALLRWRMDGREETLRGLVRDLQLARGNAAGVSQMWSGLWGQALKARAQQLIEVSVWQGAYARALVAGASDAEAVRAADDLLGPDAVGVRSVRLARAGEQDVRADDGLARLVQGFEAWTAQGAINGGVAGFSGGSAEAMRYALRVLVPVALGALLGEAWGEDGVGGVGGRKRKPASKDGGEWLSRWMDRLCGVEAECLLGVVRAARLFRKSGRYVTDALAMSATDKVAADGGAAVERKPALSTGGLQMQAQVLMQVFAEEAGLVKEMPLVGAEGATPQGWRMLEDEPDAAVAGAGSSTVDGFDEGEVFGADAEGGAGGADREAKREAKREAGREAGGRLREASARRGARVGRNAKGGAADAGLPGFGFGVKRGGADGVV